jgi:hypothetical protein
MCDSVERDEWKESCRLENGTIMSYKVKIDLRLRRGLVEIVHGCKSRLTAASLSDGGAVPFSEQPGVLRWLFYARNGAG